MNLVSGTLLLRDGAVAFKEARGGAIEVELGDRRDAAGYAGKEVVLGFRPENCDLFWSGQTSSNNCFQAVVDFVEPMGPETYFHLQTGAHAVVAAAPPVPNSPTRAIRSSSRSMPKPRISSTR